PPPLVPPAPPCGNWTTIFVVLGNEMVVPRGVPAEPPDEPDEPPMPAAPAPGETPADGASQPASGRSNRERVNARMRSFPQLLQCWRSLVIRASLCSDRKYLWPNETIRADGARSSADQSVELRPIAVSQDDLNVLDGVEVDSVFVPDPEYEVPVEWAPSKLVTHVLLDQPRVALRDRIRHVTFRRQPARVLDASVEQQGRHIRPFVIADEEWPHVRQRVRQESGRVAGLGRFRLRAIPRARAHEVDANRVDSIVEVTARKAAEIEHLTQLNITLTEAEVRLPVAIVLRVAGAAIVGKAVCAQLRATLPPAAR